MREFDDKINVLVLVDGSDTVDMHFRLFRFLLGDKVLNARLSKSHGILEGEKFKVIIYRTGYHLRGFKAHYTLNLVQDLDLHQTVAIPTTSPFSRIEKDPKWSQLFN